MSNKRFRPRNKKCQKSRTNTGKLATSRESISGPCTHSISQRNSTHFHRFQNTQDTISKVTLRIVFLYRVPVTILNCYSELAYVTFGSKGKKNQKSRFFDNI